MQALVCKTLPFSHYDVDDDLAVARSRADFAEMCLRLQTILWRGSPADFSCQKEDPAR